MIVKRFVAAAFPRFAVLELKLFSVRLRELAMSFVLVKWMDDGRISVVPSAWALHPKPLPENLPVEGTCRWKKKSSRYDVTFIAQSGKS